jgi:NADH dehydrogenase (ubiquinone) 1 alpha subcomplex subunit 9
LLTIEYPILYKLNNGQTRILPVHVLDVAEALSVMLSAPLTSVASTFHLAGPAVHTYNSLLQLVAAMTMKPVSTAPTVPKTVALAFATLVNRGLWWPTVSPDEIERRYIDDVGVEAFDAPAADVAPAGWKEASSAAKVAGTDGEAIKTFADLDMSPDFIEEHAIKFLRRYRAS